MQWSRSTWPQPHWDHSPSQWGVSMPAASLELNLWDNAPALQPRPKWLGGSWSQEAIDLLQSETLQSDGSDRSGLPKAPKVLDRLCRLCWTWSWVWKSLAESGGRVRVLEDSSRLLDFKLFFRKKNIEISCPQMEKIKIMGSILKG